MSESTYCVLMPRHLVVQGEKGRGRTWQTAEDLGGRRGLLVGDVALVCNLNSHQDCPGHCQLEKGV
jgi:hypothetical protein